VQGLEKKGEPRHAALLRRAFEQSQGEAWAETRQAVLKALVAIEREKAYDLVRAALEDPVGIVREEAWRLLRRSNPTEPKPRTPPLEPEPISEEVVVHLRDGTRPVVRVSTLRGSFSIECRPDAAPRKVSDFLRRARSGAYAGLPFHRVVSNFVVQGGDPRGDGWGSGGPFLPEEASSLPFAAGTVGNPTAGKDTGGCQIFVCLLPAPHLDGRYTVFGRVFDGMSTVGRIEIGDRILRTEVLAAGSGCPPPAAAR
jgi:cyclophilin family peptidyl-prolyl cis-trans isomerase